MANGNGKQRNNKKDGNMAWKLAKAKKEQYAIELEERRKNDFAMLEKCCKALNSAICDIQEKRAVAEETGAVLTREDTKISIETVINHFASIGEEYQSKNNIAVIVSILVDVAKCQVNPKIDTYHAVIRMIYFYEKFQAYFGEKYEEYKKNLCEEYVFLFNTHGYVEFQLNRDEGTLIAPVNDFYNVTEKSYEELLALMVSGFESTPEE